MKPHAVHPDRPLYNPDQPSWWTPARQRVVVLTFDTPEEAVAWDQCPEYDDYCPLCGGPPCDEAKHRRSKSDNGTI